MSRLSKKVTDRLRGVPAADPVEDDPDVDGAAHAAAGVTAVAVTMRRAIGQMGPLRAAQTLTKINQVDQLLPWKVASMLATEPSTR